jgi:hypothetical protein
MNLRLISLKRFLNLILLAKIDLIFLMSLMVQYFNLLILQNDHSQEVSLIL